MKDVFLATDELSKLKIQTIVPTAEQSEQVTPLATQKAACSPNSVGLASPTAKASQRGEGGAGGRPTSRTRSPATCAARHGTGLVSPSQAAAVESSLSPGKLSPLSVAVLWNCGYGGWLEPKLRATSCKASFSSTLTGRRRVIFIYLSL